jgi:hypothetical protein
MSFFVSDEVRMAPIGDGMMSPPVIGFPLSGVAGP